MKLLLTGVILGLLAVSLQAQHTTYVQTIPGTSVSFRMVAIPGGVLQQGDEGNGVPGESDEHPVREVTLSPFWMEEHEVTFEEWDQFFKNQQLPASKAIQVDAISRPTPQYIDLTWGMGRDARHPVNSMSQTAAIMYCKWLYEQTGFFYRLPTEAEWEYACKAAQKPTASQPLAKLGWYSGNSQDKYHPVMQLAPNGFGLYDLLGNLTEWTLDQYDPLAYEKSGGVDPVVPPGAKYPRVTRGGSFQDDARELRCSNRLPSSADWNRRDPQIPKSRWWLTDAMYVGFRIVRPVKQPPASEILKFYALYLK